MKTIKVLTALSAIGIVLFITVYSMRSFVREVKRTSSSASFRLNRAYVDSEYLATFIESTSDRTELARASLVAVQLLSSLPPDIFSRILEVWLDRGAGEVAGGGLDDGIGHSISPILKYEPGLRQLLFERLAKNDLQGEALGRACRWLCVAMTGKAKEYWDNSIAALCEPEKHTDADLREVLRIAFARVATINGK
ncbi:MAG: hypothetical protein JSS51_11315 [Planctomycetes bacterium]|nr:hypothetical protein [Planctomycetota bacterium]